MKKIYFILLLFVSILMACNQTGQKVKEDTTVEEVTLQSTGNFGETISSENAIQVVELEGLFESENTVSTKVTGEITACCQHSGCWMDIDMGDGQLVNITFEEGAFTVPKDAAGKNAIIEGVATREIIPVETLKLYAKDEGKSQEEIDAITEPGVSYSIVASGVIIE